MENLRDHCMGIGLRLWAFATPVDAEMGRPTPVSWIRRLGNPGCPTVGV